MARPRIDEQELRELIAQLRKRAESFRRMHYYASADVLDDRASRHEQRLLWLEARRAEDPYREVRK